MNWSLQIGSPFGIPLRIHWTFLFLFGYLILSHNASGGFDPMDALLLISVFASVVLHELGHSLAARKYGIKVRDITLWPLGGMARMESFPSEPKRQLVIAASGPAVSFALALVFGAVGYLLLPGMEPLMRFRQWIIYLAEINAILGLFNLVPALPMDGGRILRAILAMTSRKEKATRIAARVGQVFAVLMGLGGMAAGNTWLIVIAIFIFFSAERERQADEVITRFSGIPAWQAMLRPVATAGRMTSIGSLATFAAEHEQQDFPIVEEADIIGMVTRWDLMRAMVEGRRDDPVFTIMTGDVRTISPFDTLDRMLQFRSPIDRLILPVVHQARVIGLVTPEKIRRLHLV